MLKRTLLLLATLLSACTTLNTSAPKVALEKEAQWALLPILNQTETPQAGLRAEALMEASLRNAGISQLQRYPARLNQETLFEPAERKIADDAKAWAS
ncbi:MAG: penicillin-binding protein activator LpoB, partial [Neisseriaceae bacterium]